MEKSFLKNRYKQLIEIGAGGYGKVYLSEDTKPWLGTGMDIEAEKKQTKSKDIVYIALKELSVKKSGLEFTTLREIKVLKEIGHHPNIVEIKDIFYGENKIYIAMDYMPFELHNLVRNKSLSQSDIKDIMLQLLSAV